MRASEQPHQPLRVENELVAAGSSLCGWRSFPRLGKGGSPARPALREGRAHLMMVCMPRTCGVLLGTLSVLGRGWHPGAPR